MQKILIVRVGRVGDMVMISAALRAVLESWPHAELHLVTSPEGVRVLRNFDSRLTQIKTYDRKALLAWFQKQTLRRFISRQNYSNIFCFEMNPRYLQMFSGSSAQVHTIENYTLKKNYARQCLDVVNRVTGTNKQHWIELPVNETARVKSQTILAQAGIGADDIVIGLHPSFSGLRKMALRNRGTRLERGWPNASWAALARSLHEYGQQNRLNLKIMMDLLEEDRALGEQINALAGGCIKLVIPPPDFERYKATLQRMQLLVTPNTGPMHIAGAVGTRMVALFAIETPENSGPYIAAEHYTALRAEDYADARGLAAIPVDAVFNACLPYLVSSA